MDYCVITFVSSSGAIQAQRVLKDQVSFQIMPVLREISRGCGISIRFDPGHLAAARAALSALPEGQYAFYGITEGPGGIEAVPL